MRNDPLERLRLFQAGLVRIRHDGFFLHNPGYDFNGEVIPLGAGCLAAPVEDSLPFKERGGSR